MNNEEIKEILDRLKNNDFERDCNDGSCYKELYLSEIETLLDYTTNLQQENKKYRDLGFEHLCRRNEQLKNNRDKAIEILERHTRYSTGELLNILKGDSDEI